MSNVVSNVVPRPNLVTGNRPMAIVPTDMDSAYRLAKAIVLAGMAPKGMETAEKCMIAIMRGMEVGLTPLMALDKIAIVNGRPTIWGDGAIGLVRGSGLCEFVKERIEGQDVPRGPIRDTQRRGEAEPIRRTFSVADARKAGLWGKQGPWQQYPERMLQMRARAFALRDGFADVLGGLNLKEEIDDAREDVSPREEPPAPPPPRIETTVTIEHEPEPPTPDPVPPPPEPTEEIVPDVGEDPDGFKAFMISKFQAATTAEQLNDAWETYVEPVRNALFPPDEDDLMSEWRARERVLS